MKKLLVAGIIILVAAGICMAEETIRIGVSLGLTGQYAPIAKMQERGFKLWEAQVNASGGMLGKKVALTIYDDQSDKETAKKIYLRMIEKEKMDFLFPPYSSGLTTAIMPIAEKFGYPMLASGASADSIWQQGYRYVFGVYTSASRYTLGFFEMLLTHGIKKVAIISEDDSFSLDTAAGAKRWANRLGQKIVLSATLKKGEQHFDQLAQQAKKSGAEAVVMCGHFNEAVNMRKAFNAIGWYPKAYYASVGPDLAAYHELLGKDADKTFSSSQWKYYDKLPFPGAKAFYSSFIAQHKEAPSYQAATAYAAGTILKAAVENAGSLKREKVRDTLSTLDYMTIIGRYGVDSTGMQVRHVVLITQWIKGQKQVVWPVDLRTANPQF